MGARRSSFALAVLLFANAVFGQENAPDHNAVWKWADKDGVTHYSDHPGPGAVKIDLRIQTDDAPNAQPDTQPSASSAKKASQASAPYQRLAITSPSVDQTVQGPNDNVNVSVRIEPALQANHRLRVELDGKPQGEPRTALNFTFGDVPRGTHTVSASMVTADGAVVIHSKPVTFYVRQPSILSPTRKR